MTLNELMEATGASARAIKLWEGRGLLGTVERESERRRTYSEKQLTKVQFIMAAQQAGWSLERIERDMLNYGKLRQSLRNRVHALQHTLGMMADQEDQEWDL